MMIPNWKQLEKTISLEITARTYTLGALYFCKTNCIVSDGVLHVNLHFRVRCSYLPENILLEDNLVNPDNQAILEWFYSGFKDTDRQLLEHIPINYS